MAEVTSQEVVESGKVLNAQTGLAIDWLAWTAVLKPLAILALQIALQKLLNQPQAKMAAAPLKCCPEHLACHDAAVEAACASLAAAVACRECCCAE